MKKLANDTHPIVIETAQKLTAGAKDKREALKRLFLFVRDDIAFAFPPEGDFVTASQTIERGYGQCNTKGTLFLALCKASGILARLHYSKISKDIQRGFFTGPAFWLMPENLTHSWLEVEIDGEWHAIDTYINDLALHEAAVHELEARGWETGYSVSRRNGTPSADLALDGTHFSQMAAVRGDEGTCEEPSEFYASPNYLNKVGWLRQWLYRLMLPVINARVRRLRDSSATQSAT